MSHKILKSLAGTDKLYVVVKGNEGFRVRKLGDSRFRIHIEKKAPGIDSRDRPPSMRKIPYWAADVNAVGLLRALGVALHKSEDYFLGPPKVDPIPKGKAPEGIEQVMAALVVEYDKLGEQKDTLASEVSVKEKERLRIIERRKVLQALKSRLTNGMQAFMDAREALQ